MNFVTAHNNINFIDIHSPTYNLIDFNIEITETARTFTKLTFTSIKPIVF